MVDIKRNITTDIKVERDEVGRPLCPLDPRRLNPLYGKRTVKKGDRIVTKRDLSFTVPLPRRLYWVTEEKGKGTVSVLSQKESSSGMDRPKDTTKEILM